MDTWIHNARRRVAYRRLLALVLVSLAAILTIFATHEYWYPLSQCSAQFRSWRFSDTRLHSHSLHVLSGFYVVGNLLPQAWRIFGDVSADPVVKRVESWGWPPDLSNSFEQACSKGLRFKGRGMTLNENYLIKSSYFRLDIFRFNDLVWAFKRTTKHSTNGIPTGKTYKGIFCIH